MGNGQWAGGGAKEKGRTLPPERFELVPHPALEDAGGEADGRGAAVEADAGRKVRRRDQRRVAGAQVDAGRVVPAPVQAVYEGHVLGRQVGVVLVFGRQTLRSAGDGLWRHRFGFKKWRAHSLRHNGRK